LDVLACPLFDIHRRGRSRESITSSKSPRMYFFFRFLIDLSSQPYSFSTIPRVFRQLSYFSFSIFSAFNFITDRARKEYLNIGVAKLMKEKTMMNRWKENESVTHHYTRCVSDISRDSWIASESLSSLIVGQEVEVSCISNPRIVRREEPLNVTTSRQEGRKKSCCKGERWRKRRWCGSFRKIV